MLFDCEGTTIYFKQRWASDWKGPDISLTLPMSVTVTALSKLTLDDPGVSSITATLLTPCSLIAFIASNTVSAELQETTSERKLRDGNERLCRGLDKYRAKAGLLLACEWKYLMRARSVTMPRYSTGREEPERMRTDSTLFRVRNRGNKVRSTYHGASLARIRPVAPQW